MPGQEDVLLIDAKRQFEQKYDQNSSVETIYLSQRINSFGVVVFLSGRTIQYEKVEYVNSHEGRHFKRQPPELLRRPLGEINGHAIGTDLAGKRQNNTSAEKVFAL